MEVDDAGLEVKHPESRSRAELSRLPDAAHIYDVSLVGVEGEPMSGVRLRAPAPRADDEGAVRVSEQKQVPVGPFVLHHYELGERFRSIRRVLLGIVQ
jgi:hypothetical protein